MLLDMDFLNSAPGLYSETQGANGIPMSTQLYTIAKFLEETASKITSETFQPYLCSQN